jgi:nitrate reductase delta subunit
MSSFVDACDHLALLVDYPGPGFAAAVSTGRAAVARISPEAATLVGGFEVSVEGLPIERLQELYIEAFDLDPRCTLNLSWHAFGESRERGRILASLRDDLRRAGVQESAELPDHLAHVLQLVAREEPARARAMVTMIQPALDKIDEVLRHRNSPYTHLLRAVACVLAAYGDGAGRMTS